MAGIRPLRKIQLGHEAAVGTNTAATAVWRGLGVLEDQRETVFPSEDIGYISGVDRVYTSKLGGILNLASVEATYEQIIYVLEAGIKLVHTGAADGSGSGVIYNYPFPVTGANTPQSFTIEGGDDAGAEMMEGCFVPSFSLSGEAGKALMVSANWVGRQIVPQAFTASIALPTVEEILFSKCVMYADTPAGSIGATTQSNTLLQATLNVTTGLIPVYTATGQLYYSFIKTVEPKIELSVTYEHDAYAIAEKAFWKAGTARQIRLKFTGSTYTTAGTAYSAKTFIIDLAGKWSKFNGLGEQNGNDILQGTFVARYDATAALFARILATNLNATLT